MSARGNASTILPQRIDFCFPDVLLFTTEGIVLPQLYFDDFLCCVILICLLLFLLFLGHCMRLAICIYIYG